MPNFKTDAAGYLRLPSLTLRVTGNPSLTLRNIFYLTAQWNRVDLWSVVPFAFERSGFSEKLSL